MKRKNLFTNILNIVTLILIITWFILQIKVPYIYEIVILWSGTIATFSIDVFLTIVAIINIIVGIKNRKQSKLCLVLYEIIALLYIIECVLVSHALLDDFYVYDIQGILLVIYVVLWILTIVQFILNRKVKKPENKKKIEITIFIIAVILGIISTFSPLIIKKTIENKIKKAMQETGGTISSARVIGKLANENKYNFLNDDGTIAFTMEAESLDDYQIIRDGNKEMMIAIVTENSEKKLLDISDGNNPKIILTYNECNIVGDNDITNFAYMSGINSGINTNDIAISHVASDEKISPLSLQSNELNTDYKYYSNDDFAIQIIEAGSKGSTLGGQNDNQSQQSEYYVINLKNNQKIQIPCDKLIYDGDEIPLFNKKYITYIKENKNGYINVETGETLELPNDYIFLDIQDEIAAVAHVKEEDKEREEYTSYEIEDDDFQEDEQMEIVFVDKNLSIVSKEYQSISMFNKFYLLNSKKEKEGEIITNNGKVLLSNADIDKVFSDEIVSVGNEEGKYNIYNEKGKSNELYDKIFLRYAGGITRSYDGINGFSIYENVVSQMYGKENLE